VDQLRPPPGGVRELQDRAMISDLVMNCAQAQDRHDWSAVAATYAEDAVYRHPGGEMVGVEAIVQRTRNALEALDASQHLLGSMTVDVDGNTAHARCYFHAQHVREGARGGDLYTIAGTYADTLVRTPDGWRIRERVQTYQWRNGNRDVVVR
jgi:ketosteroid isomerase-like protein